MTALREYSEISRNFESHAVDNTKFGHAEHVRVAYELLKKYDFIDASSLYAKGIKAIATKAGAPEKFNTTITYAFMGLIAERMAIQRPQCFDDFVDLNPDLMTKTVLEKWYPLERIQSDIARRVFLLP
jgi:hypothetical protein